MVTYLLVTFARYSARSGWTVQRMLRVLQLNLFERRTLKQIFNPDPQAQKKRASIEARYMTVNCGTPVAQAAFLFVPTTPLTMTYFV